MRTLLLFWLWCSFAAAFTTTSLRSIPLRLRSSLQQSTFSDNDTTGGENNIDFDPSPPGLIQRAKLVVATDLGLLEPSLLDDSQFLWITPMSEQPLDKKDYLAAGRFFDLRSTFPDWDWRAYDYRVCGEDSTVRVTMRVQGTMRGSLRLRSGTLPPNGAQLQCPPEAVSITFDATTGRVTKLCSGFCLDRQVGNTLGTTGVSAAATIAGQPPSEWERFPVGQVVSRFFGRPVPILPETTSVMAPFPETVMLQLARGVLGSNLGADDPSLLGRDFYFMTPVEGPIRRAQFLANYAAQEFAGVDPVLDHFRVDPFDPSRVWVDVTPMAPGYQGAPQAMSFSFDDDGFCIRMTAGYVMDPSLGNGGGLGGPSGYLYAQERSNELTTRPLPAVLGRARKALLAPLTGVGVDEYVVKGQKREGPKAPPLKAPKPEVPKVEVPRAVLPKVEVPKAVLPKVEVPKVELPKVEVPKVELPKVELPKVELPKVEVPKVELPKPPARPPPAKAPAPKPSVAAKPAPPKDDMMAKQAEIRRKEAEAKRQEDEAKRAEKEREAKQVEAVRRAQEQAAEKERKQREMEEKREEARLVRERSLAEAQARKEEQASLRREAQEKQAAEMAARKEEAERKRAAVQAEKEAKVAARQAELKRKREEALAAQAERKAEAERKKQEAQAKVDAQAMAQKKEEDAAEAARLAKAKAERQAAALKRLSEAVTSATISLFGLTDRPSSDDLPASRKPAPKKAPTGVPTIYRWKKNSNGSVTGLIRGSRNFSNGEKVTTSKIVSGTIAAGEVVRTGSGSRYFLS